MYRGLLRLYLGNASLQCNKPERWPRVSALGSRVTQDRITRVILNKHCVQLCYNCVTTATATATATLLFLVLGRCSAPDLVKIGRDIRRSCNCKIRTPHWLGENRTRTKKSEGLGGGAPRGAEATPPNTRCCHISKTRKNSIPTNNAFR